jgi:hypothetical protein
MKTMMRNWAVAVGIGCGLILGSGEARSQTNALADPMEQDVTQGSLRVKQKDGVVECPLKHTDVKAEIGGFIARVKVTQTFLNPSDEKIEAVYVFPLPHEAAVDDMTMVIGDRRIVGLIKRRAEARQIYEAARQQERDQQAPGHHRAHRPAHLSRQVHGRGDPRHDLSDVLRCVVLFRMHDLGLVDPVPLGLPHLPGPPSMTTPILRLRFHLQRPLRRQPSWFLQ